MLVMPGLGPGIHVFLRTPKDVDGRDKPGHDDVGSNDDRVLLHAQRDKAQLAVGV